MTYNNESYENEDPIDDKFYDDDEELLDEYSDSSEEEIRLCTNCPTRLAAVTTRLKPLCLLAQEGIPCLIFGEDALALVFWVPTAVCSLHIVVADAHRDRAADIIASQSSQSCLPYYERFGPASIEYAIPAKVRSDFAHSVYLKATERYRNPAWIIVHPESFFGLDVADFTRSPPVGVYPEVSVHENIRLPKPHAMVDAIIDTLLEHGRGLLTVHGAGQLSLWLAYIIAHGFRVKSTVPGEGQDAQTMLSTQRERRKAIMDRKAKLDS